MDLPLHKFSTSGEGKRRMAQNREMGAMEVLQLLHPDAEQQKAVGNNQEAPQSPPIQCPRCYSTDTKFCYFNNYSINQPRFFCKACRRYWTLGGTLRNIPIGGTSRRRVKKCSCNNPQWNSFAAAATVGSGPMPSLMSTESGAIGALPYEFFPNAHPAFMSNSGSLSAVQKMQSVNQFMGLSNPDSVLSGGANNPYVFSNLMNADLTLSGGLNLHPCGLLQQQQQHIHCSQGNYMDGLEMPISHQLTAEQSPVPPNLHLTGPSMLQQSFNIGSNVLDPEAVLQCGNNNKDMGGFSVDPFYWSHFPEFGPSV